MRLRELSSHIRAAPTKTILRRWAAFVLAAALAAGSSPAAGDTRTQLESAREQLQALERRIVDEETRFERVQTQLAASVERSNGAAADVLAVRKQIRRIDRELDVTQARLNELRERVSERARHTYVYGPMHWVSLLLDAGSFSEFGGRLHYVGRILQQDADAALEARRLQAEFEEDLATHKRLLEEETARLRSAEREQKRLEDLFAQQQTRMASLAKTRAEALALVEQLRDRVRAEELASLARVAGHGMPITFGEWADAFLGEVGAPKTRDNLVVIVAWETAEYTQASWNPLATTYGMPGATVYNSHGVKNYLSKEQGLEASRKTLERPGHGYDAILSNLRAGSEAMTTGDAIRASNWCRGCANGRYVVGIIPAVEAYYERYASR